MLRWISLYARLAWASARSMYQYQAAFGLVALATMLAEGGMLLLISVVVARFRGVAGWEWPEIAVLYGMGLTAFAVLRLLGAALDHFDDRVVSGRFDTFLTRPVSPLLLTMADGFNPFTALSLVTGAAMLMFGLRVAQVRIGPADVAFLLAAIGGAAMIMLSTYLVVATVAFWTTRSAKLTDFFSAAGREFVNYPLSIYPLAVRMLLTFAIPFAFTTYYPAQYLLGRHEFLGLPSWLQFATPAVGVVCWLLALSFWRFGLRHYRSTGS